MSNYEKPRVTDKGEQLLGLITERPDLYVREAAKIMAGAPMPLGNYEAPEDQRRKSALFNDITEADGIVYMPFSERKALCDYLWEQGWRRDVRPEDARPWPEVEW